MNDDESTPIKSSKKSVELYEERRHLENLLNTRFNFFLVIFASLLASLFTIKNFTQFLIVLIVGAVIESLFAIVIARAQIKLGYYLDVIREIPNHAEKMANDYANDKTKNHCAIIRGSRNWIIGYFIPIAISAILIVAIPFSCLIFRSIGNDKPENELKVYLNLNSETTREFDVNLDTTKNFIINLSLKNCELRKKDCTNDTIQKKQPK